MGAAGVGFSAVGTTKSASALQRVNVVEASEEVQFGGPSLPPKILRYSEPAVRKSLLKSVRALGVRKNSRTLALRMVEVARTYVGITREEEERLRKVNIHHLKEFMPPGGETWCKVDFRVVFGAPVEEILGEARDEQAQCGAGRH